MSRHPKLTRERVAIHEAGHAVVAYHFKQPIDEIRIGAGGSYAGRSLTGMSPANAAVRTYRLDRRTGGYRETTEEEVDRMMRRRSATLRTCIYQAGQTAEMLLTGSAASPSCYSDDAKGAWESAGLIVESPPEREKFIKQCGIRACRILSQRYAQLRRLSDAILASGDLDADQIRAVLYGRKIGGKA